MSATAALPNGIYLRESLTELRKSFRLPQFALPTIITPAAFFGLFSVALNHAPPDQIAYSMATFGVFAATGPALFGFGAGVAVERETGLIELKRVSPLPASAYIVAKTTASLAMAGLALALIYAIAIVAGVRLTPVQWISLAAIHLLATLPFALIGFILGMRFGSKGAIAFANILYLGLAVVGGLWMPVSVLPGWMQTLAWATPSFHLAQIALATIGVPMRGSLVLHLTILAAISALCLWRGAALWRRNPA
jgi:ABC-2 type transport system permease protein